MLLCIGTATAAADTALMLHATEASLFLAPRNSNQTYVNLPALDIAVVAEFNCAAGVAAESITVSVADTHIRFSSEEINDATSINATLRLPADQIAPISIQDFCVTDVASEIEDLLIPGVASAQVSLRCGSEDESSIHFASIALPLRLHCESVKAQDGSSVR